ncbi:hypothetical protein PV11_02325 [Exophiala sideris]|uniref:Major facilitator superfamily (MFS) profile domain-containing protein n=1 Tax=Exophiala sideris TaxID=1016849 RepID=A0A0D1WDA6_9EURO|nr:hypothetical protein PV11_02325 [Exophiala sideris]
MIGLTFTDQLTKRFGFRKTMIATLLVAPYLIFIQCFATSLAVLEVEQILLGIFQTVTCVYAVEVAPTCLRAFLTSWVSQNWVIGQIIASCVARGVLDLAAPWALPWFWPVVLVVPVYLAPESPWWLVRQKRYEEAKVSLRRLTSGQDPDFDIGKTVTLIALTTEHERELNTGDLAALFKGTDLRRTLIVMGCYCMQIVSGTKLRAYATYFFLQAGLPTTQSFNMSIVIYVLSLAGTILAYANEFTPVVSYAIRGPAYLLPLGSQHPHDDFGLCLAQQAGFVAYVCMIPVIFAMVSEIPSSTLRSKSVALARFTYAVLNVAANVLTTYQLNPTAWAWGAKSGCFWAGSSIVGLLSRGSILLNPKGRTVAELNLLFEKKVPARSFTSTSVSVAEVTERSD